MRILIKIFAIICICITTINAELIGKAWDTSVSSTLKNGCLDVTAKEERQLNTTFTTIMISMGAKALMKEANLFDKDLENKEEIKSLIIKISASCYLGLGNSFCDFTQA